MFCKAQLSEKHDMDHIHLVLNWNQFSIPIPIQFLRVFPTQLLIDRQTTTHSLEAANEDTSGKACDKKWQGETRTTVMPPQWIASGFHERATKRHEDVTLM